MKFGRSSAFGGILVGWSSTALLVCACGGGGAASSAGAGASAGSPEAEAGGPGTPSNGGSPPMEELSAGKSSKGGSDGSAGSLSNVAGEAPVAGAAGAGESPDVGAPTIVATIPEADAKGVTESAVLVFQFSEAMDGPATEAAYVSAELPAAAVTFTWNDAGDTLTIVPKTKLTYAEGDQAVMPAAYAARITTDATDRDGVALAEEAIVSFSTLRRITFQAPGIGSLTRCIRSSGGVLAPLQIGDTVGDAGSRSVFAFSLESMPSTFKTLEKATFRSVESAIYSNPDGALGTLAAQHVYYEAATADVYSLEPMDSINAVRQLGLNGNPNARTADVTSFVADDLENRAARKDRTELRLQYPKITPDGVGNYVQLNAAGTTLELRYLAE